MKFGSWHETLHVAFISNFMCHLFSQDEYKTFQSSSIRILTDTSLITITKSMTYKSYKNLMKN